MLTLFNRLPDEDKPPFFLVVLVFGFLMWCLLTCNSGCSFKEADVYTQVSAKLIRIDTTTRWVSDGAFQKQVTGYWLVYNVNDRERFYKTFSPSSYTVGETDLITITNY